LRWPMDCDASRPRPVDVRCAHSSRPCAQTTAARSADSGGTRPTARQVGPRQLPPAVPARHQARADTQAAAQHSASRPTMSSPPHGVRLRTPLSAPASAPQQSDLGAQANGSADPAATACWPPPTGNTTATAATKRTQPHTAPTGPTAPGPTTCCPSMPPIGSNANPTDLDRTNNYVERSLTEISDFAGKPWAVERAFHITVRVTYIPLRGIPRNGIGRGASEKDQTLGTSPASYLTAAIGYVTPDDEHHGRGPAIRRARAAGLKRARVERIKP
jgi:hypothetical protein